MASVTSVTSVTCVASRRFSGHGDSSLELSREGSGQRRPTQPVTSEASMMQPIPAEIKVGVRCQAERSESYKLLLPSER